MTALTRYPPERQRAIADFLLAQEDRRATVTQISEHLEVTTETVRRDLDTLERRGLLRRVRGGAQLLDAVPFEVALAARHAEQHEDKRRIATRLAEELPHDGVLVLDSGSLTLFAAQAVPRDAVLTVVTNNLPAARHLADHPGVQVITLPGMVRGLTSAAVDAWTSRRLQSLTVDVAVVGVNGMSAAQGLTTTNPEEASAKRAMLLSARRRIVPVISGKLGRNSFCSFAAVSELDLVLTDAAAPDTIIAELAAAGPEVVVVG
ncbi:transcriptional regulator, DeoR family [Microlunatus sagamiharensis]|uniref:Lactose phosphotransferase system repressor n=1 Tax=Microlunatus sagamiharensis TaxID=546874 RepID=A0A1H2LWE7_9ACTN|nr:DeoR/GlpR family DNA-binding transcription regulator [Microlunatus sagamiharensis]SDU85269.1 transcriptional regulator, DeoR family [Microlunatus sagamiharensis]